MKNLFLIFAAFPIILYAQDTPVKRTMLEPVEIQSTSMGKSVIAIPLKEKHKGEFEKDPVTFMVNNVNALEILEKLQEAGYAGFMVIFKTRKGQLLGNYDSYGVLQTYSMNFKNVAVPKHVAWQLYDQYKGWQMIENTQIVTNGNTPRSKETYKVVMKNGKSKKNLKISREPGSEGRLVFNE